MTFKVHVPQLALVTFVVYAKEVLAAQYTLPFHSIQSGNQAIKFYTSWHQLYVW